MSNYKCKCGCTDMFVKNNGNQIGLYCKSCGKWQKWLNKNEFRAFENNKSQEDLVHNINDFIDFLDEEIKRQLSKEPLSIEDTLSKCSYAHAYERVKETLIDIVNEKKCNKYDRFNNI